MEAHAPRLAKFTPPDASELVSRERLLAKLNKASRHTAVWVTGPAGAGKTALVASWLATAKLRSVWYSLDEGDGDPATFFHYLTLAVRTATTSAGILPVFSLEYLPALDTFARHYFETLFVQWEPPWVLVLDNYDAVPASSPLSRVVESALRSITRGGTLLVMSRQDPPARFARWQATNEMTRLTWNDLKLTDEEAAAFVRRWGFDPQTLQPVVQASGGWPAGLMLMLNAYNDGTRLPSAGTVPTPVLFDFFAEESFAKAPLNQREFLVKTAFLPRLTVAMAERLSGQTDAGEILAELNRQNLFTERRGGPEGTYEYHPLFRRFLLDRAELAFPPEEFARRRRGAAAALENDGQIEAAAELYAQGREWDELTRLIRQHASLLVAQGRHPTLLGWLRAMPERVVAASPWLSFRLGSCVLLQEPEGARPWLERAFAMFKQEDEPAGMYLTWAAIMETFTLQWGTFPEVDRWIAELEELQARHPDYPSIDIEVRVMNGGLAIMIRRLQHPILRRWAERARELMPILPHPQPRAQLAAFAMQYALWRGDLKSSRGIRAELEAVTATGQVAPLAAQSCLLWEAVQDLFDADVETAREKLRKLLAATEESGVHVLDVWHHYYAAYAALMANDLAAAERHASSMQAALLPGQLANKINYQYLRAVLLLYRGDVHRALELEEEYLGLCDELGSGIASALYRNQIALTLLAAGDHGRAREMLVRSLELTDELGSELVRFPGLCALAQSLLTTGEKELGMSVLRRAFAIGAAQGLMICFPVWLPEMMANLCTRALEAGIEVPYVRRLIEKRGLEPPDTTILTWPWPLKIYTLGRFVIERRGKPLHSSGKAQHKPLDLLKVLIALGGRDVNTRVLTEALWPDAEGDAAQGAFDATLHRLRRLLGVENAVQLKDGKLGFNDRLCWVDAWTFEQLCQQDESAEQERSADGVAREAQLVRHLYRGPFMASEDDQPWMLQSRERLRSLFRRHVVVVGQQLEDRYQWNQTIELYQHALDIDPLAEEVYQRLMLAERELGRIAEALDIYRRCRETLSAALGIRPSAATEAIHRSLRDSQPDGSSAVPGSSGK